MKSWKPRSLLASWVVWWLVLILWGIWPAIGPIWRVTRPGAKGNASVSFGDGGFSATITNGTATAWEGHISFLRLILLAGIPPLVLWLLWLRAQKKRDPDRQLLGDPARPMDVADVPSHVHTPRDR